MSFGGIDVRWEGADFIREEVSSGVKECGRLCWPILGGCVVEGKERGGCGGGWGGEGRCGVTAVGGKDKGGAVLVDGGGDESMCMYVGGLVKMS